MSSKHESYLNLFDFPDEILIMILKELSIGEHINLYETCTRIRRLLTERDVVSTKIKFSRNTQFGAETIQEPLLLDVAYAITELDIKLIPNLKKSKVLPVLKKMKNLQKLDVSYTNIDLADFHNYGTSHKITAITVDAKTRLGRVLHGVLNFLNDMESIHLVSMDKMSHLVTLLRSAIEKTFHNLKKVTLTTPGKQMSVTVSANIPSIEKWVGISFSLNLELMQEFLWGYIDTDWHFVITLDFEANTALYMSDNLHNFYHRSALYPYWVSTTTPVLHAALQRHKKWTGYMWYKDVVDSNPQFYDEILRELGSKLIYFSYYYPPMKDIIKWVHSSSTNYFLSSCNFDRSTEEENEVELGPTQAKRKSRSRMIVFNIDKHVKESEDIKLILASDCLCHVQRRIEGDFDGVMYFDVTSKLAGNITYINLHNIILLDSSFYKHLFENCTKLYTLNIDNNKQTMACKYLCNAICLAKSLVNLRVKEPNVTSARFYECLAGCSKLENLHICDLAIKLSNVPNKTLTNLVEQCDKLYSFALYSKFQSLMSHNRLMKVMKVTAAKKNNTAINFNLVNVATIEKYQEAILRDGHVDIFFIHSSYKSFNLNINF